MVFQYFFQLLMNWTQVFKTNIFSPVHNFSGPVAGTGPSSCEILVQSTHSRSVFPNHLYRDHKCSLSSLEVLPKNLNNLFYSQMLRKLKKVGKHWPDFLIQLLNILILRKLEWKALKDGNQRMKTNNYFSFGTLGGIKVF